jgi:predicted DNA-binding protein
MKKRQYMTITLPLEPQKAARLIALAQEKGLSTDEFVREAMDKILAEVPEASPRKEPTRSLRGLLAKYGPAPSADEIDQNRAEMFANFPRSDF